MVLGRRARARPVVAALERARELRKPFVEPRRQDVGRGVPEQAARVFELERGPGVAVPAAARAQDDHVAGLTRQQVGALRLVQERPPDPAIVERVHARGDRVGGNRPPRDEGRAGAEVLQIDGEPQRVVEESELQTS